MTFSPCGSCPGPKTCNEGEARMRAQRGACEAFLPEPEPCSEEVRPATYYDPPEYCENDAAPGSDFCYEHDPDLIADLLEARAEARRDAALERLL